ICFSFYFIFLIFFFSSRRRHTRSKRDWSSDVCSSDLVLEVRARRVGGSNYQVPMEVRPERRQALGLRYLVNYSRLRSEKTMQEKLANEILDASNNTGSSVRRKEELHKMAE